MGAQVSSKFENGQLVHPTMKQHYFKEKVWPCEVRQKTIFSIRNSVSKDQIPEALVKMEQLKRLGGDQEVNADNTGYSFVVDESGEKMVLELLRIVSTKSDKWQEHADFLCHQLLAHVSPPSMKTKFDDSHLESTTEINITGVTLFNKPQLLQKLTERLDVNKGLVVLELAFTGITNKELQKVLPHAMNLPNLTYLGLKGNRLDSSIIPVFMKLLQNSTKFQCLQWIDVRNNIDISTLPKRLLYLLKQRWPPDNPPPSFRDLANGKALLVEECEDF